jgi:hypothetical protein
MGLAKLLHFWQRQGTRQRCQRQPVDPLMELSFQLVSELDWPKPCYLRASISEARGGRSKERKQKEEEKKKNTKNALPSRTATALDRDEPFDAPNNKHS